ncbi:MAG TPA: sodium/proton-translocating pyrophosphatase, partial [Herpetosiphonaceae bacterium]|nr:sodium/proton-translocating pyrophosphatase [Herpetosiphonaceae bacterium]
IMDYTVKPDYARVVDICTRSSLRELVSPGLLAIVTPIVVGFGLGAVALGAYLAGAILCGQLLAVALSNSGGAWDNAKKFIEDGNYGGKNSPAHEAGVIGDTVGDPFKDTAGPALNPLIKVMNLVSLLAAGSIVTAVDTNNMGLRVAMVVGGLIVLIGALLFSAKQEEADFGAGEPTEPSKRIEEAV